LRSGWLSGPETRFTTTSSGSVARSHRRRSSTSASRTWSATPRTCWSAAIRIGLGTAEEFRATFPEVTYRQIAAGEPLPFADKFFDISVSNAVLEHVGSPQNQQRFLAEQMRVARRVFITVPHRYFPVEHHTGIPFMHWTDFGFDLTCRLLGKRHWSQQENLILMSRKRLQARCPSGTRVEIGTTGIRLGPCSANLYLYWNGQNAA
jgi:SAM-dependent methyltransferase